MTNLAKPQVICTVKMPAVGIGFHREILESMTTPELLLSGRRVSRSTVPKAWRAVAAVLIRLNSGMTWPPIGEIVGFRDSSACAYTFRKTRPLAAWGHEALYLCGLHRELIDARMMLTSPLPAWLWATAWEDMKK